MTRALVELLRPPNVFTAVADSFAGLVLARAGHLALGDRGLWCLPASACLYLGGMALNDYFDRTVDAVERPERPIPSGRVPAHVAAALGFGLLAAGVLLAALAGRRSLVVALLLAVAIGMYDAVLKGSVAGYFNMGLCRALNFAMPLSLAGAALSPALLVPPMLLLLYIAALTHLSAGEVGGNLLERARAGVVMMLELALLVLLAVWSFGSGIAGWIFFAAVCIRGAMLFAPLWTSPGGPTTGRAIGGGIVLIPVFDATFVAAAGHAGWALAVAAWALPALMLKRFYSPT